jgi:hypothetical protein
MLLRFDQFWAIANDLTEVDPLCPSVAQEEVGREGWAWGGARIGVNAIPFDINGGFDDRLDRRQCAL